MWADAQDQSLWFYHQYLIWTLDPRNDQYHMTSSERETCLSTQIRQIEELLAVVEEDEEDVTTSAEKKYILQALITMHNLRIHLNTDVERSRRYVQTQAQQLQTIDPLRAGRYQDLERSIS